MDTMDTDLFCPVNRSLLYDEIVDSFSRLFGNGFANANANANANAYGDAYGDATLLTYIHSFAILCSVIIIGFGGGFVAVAMIYTAGLDSKDGLADADYDADDGLADVPFESKYGTGLTKQYFIDNELENQQNIDLGFVEEKTPEGNVLLSYDADLGVFIYYSKSGRGITYKYLETLARKYVVIFDKRDIIVNIFKELYDSYLEVEEKKQADADAAHDADASHDDDAVHDADSTDVEVDVFATFKTYNNGTLVTSSGDGVSASDEPSTRSVNKYAVINKKSNQYKLLGGYDDFDLNIRNKHIQKDNSKDNGKDMSGLEKQRKVRDITFSKFKKI